MERIVEITPAFDRRNQDPNKNYGIHGCELRMVLKGEKGAVQFVLYTGWMLPHVEAELKGKSHLMEPLPADVGYHSLTPRYDGQDGMGSCQYLDGATCYYDGSGLQAEDAFKVLREGGSDALWKYLEDKYIYLFETTSD